MIKSMTGFGRCEVLKDSRKFTVELKGVNHRYLDVNIRMPKKLNFLRHRSVLCSSSMRTEGRLTFLLHMKIHQRIRYR